MRVLLSETEHFHRAQVLLTEKNTNIREKCQALLTCS